MSEQDEFAEECRRDVRDIADDLADLYDSTLTRNTAEERLRELREALEDAEEEAIEDIMIDIEDLETRIGRGDPLSLGDYLQDTLDHEYRITSDGEYASVEILVTCGGPHIVIDTGERAVKLWWGTTRVEAPLSRYVCEAIDEEYRALWDQIVEEAGSRVRRRY